MSFHKSEFFLNLWKSYLFRWERFKGSFICLLRKGEAGPLWAWGPLAGLRGWDAGVEGSVHKASEWAPKLWVHEYTHMFLCSSGRRGSGILERSGLVSLVLQGTQNARGPGASPRGHTLPGRIHSNGGLSQGQRGPRRLSVLDLP